jgi:hypothetical protein
MNVVVYRKYVVHGWTPVLSENLDVVFRNVYSGVWIMNGSILAGWSWKDVFRPTMCISIAQSKREYEDALVPALRDYRFRRDRRTVSLIFVNHGVPMYLAEIVAEYA